MMLKGGVHHLELIWLMHKQCALTGQRQNFQSERCPWTDYRLAVGVARIGAFALLCIALLCLALLCIVLLCFVFALHCFALHCFAVS